MDDVISLIDALAWPLVVLFAVVLFRHDASALIRSLQRVKVGPVAAEWERQSATVAAQIEPTPSPPPDALARALTARLPNEVYLLARKLPGAAIVRAHEEVERALRELVPPEAQADLEGPVTATALARLALERGLITPETRTAVEGVTIMRNLAAHGSDVIEQRAYEYLELVEGVLYAIANRPGTRSHT